MPEVHLFVLWSEARHAEARIVDDLSRRFRVLDQVEVVWSEVAFAGNLTRFYGSALPAGSEKERHCGTGPMLVVVVEDPQPRYRPRRVGGGHRWVNTAVIDARSRYRDWTGRGFRVHASEHQREADRDLVLLFGRPGSHFLGATPPRGSPRRHERDLIGTHGWRDISELLLALEVTAGRRILTDAPDGDLVLEVGDLWWAEHVAGGTDLGDGRREVRVDGRPFTLRLVESRARPARSIMGRVRSILPPAR
jgi:hypothetical protein